MFVVAPFLSLQAFLKSEVSAENILFWQACEKFKQIPAASVDEVRWPIITGVCRSFWTFSFQLRFIKIVTKETCLVKIWTQSRSKCEQSCHQTYLFVVIFQLKAEARSIYNVYLSEDAPNPVNIDDTAKTEEKDLEEPTPDMFNKAQTQVCAPNNAPMHV